MRRAITAACLLAVLAFAGPFLLEASCPKAPPRVPKGDKITLVLDLSRPRMEQIREQLGPDEMFEYYTNLKRVGPEIQERIWKATADLFEGQTKEKKEALEAFKGIGEPALRRLGRLANYSSRLDVRLAALMVLEGIKSQHTVTMVLPLLGDKSAPIREMAARIIEKHPANVYLTEIALYCAHKDEGVSKLASRLYWKLIPDDLKAYLAKVTKNKETLDLRQLIGKRREISVFVNAFKEKPLEVGSQRLLFHLLAFSRLPELDKLFPLCTIPTDDEQNAANVSRKLSELLIRPVDEVVAKKEWLATLLRHKDPGIQLETLHVIRQAAVQDFINILIEHGLTPAEWIKYDKADALLADITFQYQIFVNPLSTSEELEANREAWKVWWKTQNHTGGVPIPGPEAEGWVAVELKAPASALKPTPEELAIGRNVKAGEVKILDVEQIFSEIAASAHERPEVTVRDGTFDGKKLRVIDNSRNGMFDDFGCDKLQVLGDERWGCFLSRIAKIAGKLYYCRVARDGSTLWLKAYTGPVGALKVETQLVKDARLAIIKFQAGSLWFALEEGQSTLTIPVASYSLGAGLVQRHHKNENAQHSAVISVGGSPPVTVDAAKESVVRLGFPFQGSMEVSHRQRPVPGGTFVEELLLQVPDIFGANLEQYSTFISDEHVWQVEILGADGKPLHKDTWKKNPDVKATVVNYAALQESIQRISSFQEQMGSYEDLMASIPRTDIMVSAPGWVPLPVPLDPLLKSGLKSVVVVVRGTIFQLGDVEIRKTVDLSQIKP